MWLCDLVALVTPRLLTLSSAKLIILCRQASTKERIVWRTKRKSPPNAFSELLLPQKRLLKSCHPIL